MKNWWLQLNAREQRLVSVLGSVFVVFLLYNLVWQPLNDNLEKGQKKLERQQELLAFVTSETARYRANKGTARGKSSGSLSGIINRTARAQGITIARVQPQSNDIQVWIDNVAFEKLLLWVQQLSANEGIQVKTIDLTRSDLPGQVRVKRLQLGKG